MLDPMINVQDLPGDAAENELAGSTVVVIDLLRASTTICYALAAGASAVVPFRTIDETLAAAERIGRDRVVLGGERGGKRIECFDLGNSPWEYTPESVSGRQVFITTTNGTQALYHARLARRVLVGAIVNLSAIAASVRDEARVDILCAGTNGRATGEDILAAGALVCRIQQHAKELARLSDRAAIAADHWRALENDATATGRSTIEQLSINLRDTDGGRNLLDIGLEHDLADCAQIDRRSIVPELDVGAWRITAKVPQDSV